MNIKFFMDESYIKNIVVFKKAKKIGEIK
jgi:hypothetical protein